MKFEVLKRSHLKRNIIIGIIVILIFSAAIITFTRAKYRVTESISLVSGTISFSPYDFNVVAMYLNKNGESIVTKKAPHIGYTLNEEQSKCMLDDEETVDGEIIFEDGNLYFNKMNYSGTKCSLYFDLIPDSENPTLNISTSSTDTSITVTANANDNIGIYYYYYKLDSGEEVRLEENTYIFEGLQKDDVHTVSVRVEDAAGNEANTSKEVTVGLRAADIILANEGGAAIIESKEIPNFSQVATTDEGMYAVEDDNGISYYYRGAVNDNWFYFGGYYWRIIRINGDKSIRLMYNGTTNDSAENNIAINNGETVKFGILSNNNMYVGYMYGSNSSDYNATHNNKNNSSIKTTIDTWYSSNLASYAEYLEGNAGFCGNREPSTNSNAINGVGGTGTTPTYYGAYVKLVYNKMPNLKCPSENDLYTTKESIKGNKALTYPIGLITADEVAFAGGVNGINNKDYYLYNGKDYWTMTPSGYYGGYAREFIVNTQGNFGDANLTHTYSVFPVINLKADILITGEGTVSDPFKVV